MRRSPGFCALLVAILALGIGASTAMVTVADTVVLRPLEYPQAEDLYLIHSRFGEMSFGSSSLPNLLDVRAGTAVFSWVGGARDRSPALVALGEPERISLVDVTEGYLAQLGASVVLGRAFDPSDHRSGAEPVALLSHVQWQRQWDGSRAVLGSKVLLDGEPVTVVGVMSPRFRDPAPVEARVQTSVWMPIRDGDPQLADRGDFHIAALARLAPGVDRAAAGAELGRIAAAIAQAYPDAATMQGHGLGMELHPLRELTVGKLARQRLLLVLGASLLLLVLVWVNAANLLLSRGDARQPELFVRSALGASRGRLVRQLLVESLALATSGGMLGLLLGALALRAFVALAPNEVPRLHEIALDWRAVAFAVVATLVTAVAFGALPALRGARSSAGARVTASRHSVRTQSLLVAAEVALALVLVAGSALLLDSFRRLLRVDPGFSTEDLLLVEVRAPVPGREVDRQRRFYGELLERASALPGVRLAGLSYHVPGGRGGSWGRITIEGAQPDGLDREFVRINPQQGRYLATIGVPVVEGTTFRGDEDESSPPVVVLNQAAAARFFPDGTSAVGRRLAFGSPEEGADLRTVIGVVGDTRQVGLAADPEPEVHVPYSQSHVPRLLLTLRLAPGLEPPVDELRGLLAEIAPGVPIDTVRPVEELLAESIEEQKFLAFLVSGFGAFALALATAGSYATASYAAARRRRELAIRQALGARSGSLLRRAVLGTGLVAGAGALAGLAATAALSRWLEAYLFEISAVEPRILALVTALLVGAAVLAAFAPARRASSVDPVQVLRSE
jgi:predicted permease